ncbi:Glycosyl hydrolase family protein isoform 2 [Hibiscus syriacus]|uniref:Glycosyl hydrolase family protein isoform 2 n=1 Tax=Hibiscus syriacus TaxID=106335 RepID=A0A6A2Y3Z9_HIBSY|nr:Glycosyl hydrolase family protein isoform 2 [Hibiscus syriacus]
MAGTRMTIYFMGLLLWCCLTKAEYMKYKDPKQPVRVRVKDLLDRMTLEEKIGQMVQIERSVASAEVMNKYLIGEHHLECVKWRRSAPAPQASAEDWINMINEFQNGSLSTRLHIPMIYGIDAVHGNNNVYKATIFPHNIGLDAMSSGLGMSVGYVYASGTLNWLRKLGLQQHSKLGQLAFHAFAPCIAVCRDPRWGRCYESYSEDPQIVQAMTEMVPGLQGDIPANSPKGIPFVAGNKNVAACAKHYVGDGGTTDGINENNTVINWHGLLSIHMPGYYTAIAKGVSTIMVSYSSWNGVKMHANRNLVTGFLKNMLRFRGFVISDWEGIDRITSPPHANYTYSIQAGIQAGIDMGLSSRMGRSTGSPLIMLTIPTQFKPESKPASTCEENFESKFAMGLFENPLADYNLVDQLGNQDMSKHTDTLTPENDSIGFLHLSFANMQIAVKTAIMIAGEYPYAETNGDSMNLTIPDPSPTIITNVCGAWKCVINIRSTRRDRTICRLHGCSSCGMVAGNEGQGVADVVFGDYGFSGKLPRTWFKTVDQLPMNVGDQHYDPLFPFGFGLTTDPTKLLDATQTIRMWLGTFETAEETARAYEKPLALSAVPILVASSDSPLAYRIQIFLTEKKDNNQSINKVLLSQYPLNKFHHQFQP